MDVFLIDELLNEILLWLPVPCLYDFRRVSKKWREIISSSYFKELLRKRNKKLEERDLLSLLGFSVTECELETCIFTYIISDTYDYFYFL